jgi:hypothetical protein
MHRTIDVFFAAVLFSAVYVATYEAQNWVTVYWLGEWDPKFGTESGAIAFGHSVLPFVFLPALLAWSVASAIHAGWLSRASAGISAAAHAIAGLVAATAPFWFARALGDALPSGLATGLLLIVVTPAIGIAALFAVLRWRVPQRGGQTV